MFNTLQHINTNIGQADNGELWDVEDKHYIDFAAGIAVINIGHCNAAVTLAITEQAVKFSHAAFQVTAYETYISLAERLNTLAPIANSKTMLFTTRRRGAGKHQ